MNNNLPWIEKYRPKNINDIVSHIYILEYIKNAITTNSLVHMLFYGPCGVGKTSTIKTICNILYGNNKSNMLLELNASDDRNINIVRERIKNFVSSKNNVDKKYKLVILDEADQLTHEAQTGLCSILDNYVKNARFCIICNNISKLRNVLISRCATFKFAPLPTQYILQYLGFIARNENIIYSSDGLFAIVRICNGDLRRAINLLQSTHMSHGFINEDTVYDNINYPSPSQIKKILCWIRTKSINDAYKKINMYKAKMSYNLKGILPLLHNVLCKSCTNESKLLLIYVKFADIENRLSIGCSEEIQTLCLICTISNIVKMIK